MILYVDIDCIEEEFEIINDVKRIDLLRKMYSLEAYNETKLSKEFNHPIVFGTINNWKCT